MRAVVLALAVALVAGQHLHLTPEFTVGKTYVYKYDAILMGGLPEERLSKAGVKVSSKVLINAVAPDLYMLKLEEPELFEFTGVEREDSFVKATKLTTALASELLTPIKFEYTNGVVGKIYAPETIAELVMNIHRGILSVLQLNIKKTQNVYELQEAGVQGVCKTLYAISEDEKADRILLTKTKDLNNCQERIIKDVGLAYTERSVEFQQDIKSLRGAAAYDYVMKQTPAGALILEATVNELIQFAPIRESSVATQMETKQSLVFVEIQRTPITPITVDYVHRGSLKYVFASELLQTPIELIKITNAKTQIVETLNELILHTEEKVHEDAPLKFVELIQLLRKANLEDVEMIWNQYKTKSDVRQWLLDAIPAVGTPVALRMIKEKFVADELTIAEALQALVASVHMTTATTETIKLFEDLTVEPKILENPILRQVILLGYGSMVAKFCAERTICPTELIRPLHEKIVEATGKRDIEELILLLKALGNAGQPISLKPITKVLPIFGTAATTLPMRVHAEAILALRNIAKKEPRLIQEVAVQLFMHKPLHPELRMLACIVLFETKPPLGLVTTLANVLKTEENLQVASFTYSHMKSLAKTTTTHPALVAACNVALKILSPKLDRLNYRFSKAIHLDAFNNPLMLGAAASAFYINDAATILPRSVVAKARAYLAGAAADVLEVGIRTEGLQEALLKDPTIIESEDRITKMKRVIKALSDWRSLPTSQPLASVYIKFFGQEMAFANVDKTIIDQAIAVATALPIEDYGKTALKSLLSGISFKFAKPVLATEVRRIMPTAVGLPMELSLYTAAVAAASVEVKAIIEPALPEPIRAAHFLEREMKLETEIKPSTAVQSFAAMGVNTEWLQSAVVARAKLNTIMPAKIALSLDIKEGNFKAEILPVTVPEDIAIAHFETLAIARNVEDLPAAKIVPIVPVRQLTSKVASSLLSHETRSSELLLDEPDMKPLVLNKKSQFEKVLIAKAIGFESRLKIATENAAFIREGLFYEAIGKHVASVSLKPVEEGVIEKLELEVQVGPKAAEKIMREIHLTSEEVVEEKPALHRLQKILVPGLKNRERSVSSSSSMSILSSSSRSSSRLSRSSILSSSRSSSSSRSTRSPLSKQVEIIYNFEKNHKKEKTLVSEARETRSSASFEAIQKQTKFLGEALPPLFTVIARVVRKDAVEEGVQITGYLDKETQRVQLILALLESPWKMCADGVLLSMYKVSAKVAWGLECREYDAMLTAETGLLAKSPAARLRLSWTKLPALFLAYVKEYTKLAAEHIPESYLPAGLIEAKEMNNGNQLSLTVAVPTERLVEIFVKSPKRTYKLPLHLPIDLPLDKINGLAPLDEILDEIQYMLNEVNAAECSFVRDTLTTFNDRRYRNEMPVSCYQVLAQDCTQELKFLVLLKKDHMEQNYINVKIADIDIDMYPKNANVIVKVNGLEIPITNLPYQHPTGKIQIKQKGEGIALIAPSHGLHEVYFDRTSWKVKVVDWMKGQTCGLCGRADGEVRQEYRTPNGYLTKNTVSYAHSWVLPAESCRDATECLMRLESVKLERQIAVHGEESKCYSVEPVLRCLPGCLPTRTTPVSVGFHCVPTALNIEPSESLTNIHEKSVDLRETTEAHVACSCTARCA